jgi:type IV pilus assembly protein PilV
MMPGKFRQHGGFLLQSLVAIALFSSGVLVLLMLSGTAVRQVANAHYRASASLLAAQLLAQMWLGPHDSARLRAAYAKEGAGYAAWQQAVDRALPGAAALPPQVGIDHAGKITITIRWQAPGDALPHQHVVATQIPG